MKNNSHFHKSSDNRHKKHQADTTAQKHRADTTAQNGFSRVSRQKNGIAGQRDSTSVQNDGNDIMRIQWYPGHMAKTRRMIAEHLRQVDAVCEILDARIPFSSRNPDVDALTAQKPRLMILNRAGQADPHTTGLWTAYFQRQGFAVLETDAKSGRGTGKFSSALRELLAEVIQHREERGQTGHPLRVMILGIPNVGKSTFINRLAGRAVAKAEDRPGVTRGKQWVRVDKGLDLLDTPGILWPRFDDPQAGLYLAFTGAVRDEVLDTETLGCHLMVCLAERYPEALRTGYRLEELPRREDMENDIAYGYRLLETAGRRRGFLISGGETDTERMARILLDEFRGGRLGRFTLEYPPDVSPDVSGTSVKSPDVSGTSAQSPDTAENPVKSPDVSGTSVKSPDMPENSVESPDGELL